MLPVSGNYALVIDPYYGETLAAQVTLLPGVSDTLTPTGPPGSYATTAAGQKRLSHLCSDGVSELGGWVSAIW